MTEIQIILSKIAEEAGEVAQAAMKAQKYGLNNKREGNPSKGELLMKEFVDLGFAVVKLVEAVPQLEDIIDRETGKDVEALKEEKWKTMLEKCKNYED